MTNIQLLEPLGLTCSADSSVTTSGIVSYQWTIGCDSDCSWSGTMNTTLSNPSIRGRDYGDYTCTITEGSTVIGRNVFAIDHIEGEFGGTNTVQVLEHTISLGSCSYAVN